MRHLTFKVGFARGAHGSDLRSSGIATPASKVMRVTRVTSGLLPGHPLACMRFMGADVPIVGRAF